MPAVGGIHQSCVQREYHCLFLAMATPLHSRPAGSIDETPLRLRASIDHRLLIIT